MQFRYLKAKELLQSNPTMKIKDVSVAVGCTNPKMLTRLFKKYRNTTVSIIRGRYDDD